MATMQQMESAGFGDSLEERTFFKRPPPSSRLAAQVVVTQPVVMAPAIQQMESLGFGDCLEERIFFTGPPSSREPNRLARLEARKAAAGLMRAFVARGWEDEAHCERVASWSRRLARELKLTAERVLDVELGALLHDVGYIKLRHIEFAKSGPLTAGERFEMRRHAELGVALLQENPRASTRHPPRRRAPRALRRHGLPVRRSRRPDPDRRAHLPHRGRLRRADHRSSVPRADVGRGRSSRDRTRCGHPLRPRRSRGIRLHRPLGVARSRRQPRMSAADSMVTQAEWVSDEELLRDDQDFAPESGIHPTLRCLAEGEDLRAALLQLCHDATPPGRVWSIAPVPRRTRRKG